jgi:hypothetical protein
VPGERAFQPLRVRLEERVLCGVREDGRHDSPAIYIAEPESFCCPTQLSPFITINILSF